MSAVVQIFSKTYQILDEMLAALGATLAPFLGAIPGSIITRKNIGPWYQHIKKPSWRPPNWAFGPVWTCLVIL